MADYSYMNRDQMEAEIRACQALLNESDHKIIQTLEGICDCTSATGIINFLKSGGGQAYTVEEICKAILNGDGGKSTVYRIISRLVDDGILRRISDGKTRHVTYQYIRVGSCAEHLHLKCKDCGRLIHLDDVTSHILEKRIFNTEGFALDEGALIYGHCDRCIYAAKEEAR